MIKRRCGCTASCAGLALVASIIVGIIAAFLSFTAVITLTPAFLWTAFGIGIVYLGILTATSLLGGGRGGCVCENLGTLLIGLLGLILSALVLLGVTFGAGSVLGAIFAGATIGFLALTAGASACLVKCLSGCAEDS